MQNHKQRIAKVFSAAVSAGVCFLYAGIAYAQSYTVVPLATVPTLTTAGTAVNPVTYVQSLYAFAIGIGAVIAVVSGVYAGIEYMLSESSFTNKTKALERIKNVGWGAALLFCSWLLLDIINPQLVNWNLNLGANTINTTNISNGIQSNLQAQAAQAQEAIYSAQVINDVQATKQAQASLATAQERLTSLQEADCVGDSTGDCDPTDPNSAISKAQASVTAQQTALTSAQAQTIVDQLGSDLNKQLVDIQNTQQELAAAGVTLTQTQSAINAGALGAPLVLYNIVSGNLSVAAVNAPADVAALNQSLQNANDIATKANVDLGNLITQAQQANNQALVAQLQKQKATLTQQYQAFSSSAKTTK